MTAARRTTIEEDVVEGALESVGWPWKRRGQDWVVSAGGQRRCEITLTPRDGGLRIESVLASWDEIGPTEKEALARFLGRAQSSLRFARCELAERQAVAAAQVAAADLEAALPHAVGAVAAAAKMLSREVRSLLSMETAEGYLRFFAGAHEMSADAVRI